MGNYSLSPIIEKYVTSTYSKSGDIPTHKKIVRWMEKNHPEAVDKYMETHRTGLLSGAVTKTLAAQRNHLKNSQMAIRLMDGSVDGVFDTKKLWATVFFVPGEGWKALGQLTGEDHSAIAEKYELLADASTSRASLHRELAEKVGSNTTEEVMKPRFVVRSIARAYNPLPALGGAR